MSKTKLGIFSDTHLSHRQYGLLERENDFKFAFESCIDICIAEKCNAVIVAGDIIDIKRPSSDCIMFLKRMNEKAKSAGLPVFYITGNHENCSPNWLDIIGGASTGFINLDSRIESVNDVSIHGLPEMSKDDYIEAFKTIEPGRVLVMHSSIEEFIGIGINNPLSIKDLPTDKFDIIIVGDTHVAAQIPVKDCTVLSPGSTEMKTSNEPTDKFVWIAEFEGIKDSLRRVKIPTRNVVTLNIDNEEELEAATEELKATKGTMKRIVYLNYNAEVPNVLTKLALEIDSGKDIFRFKHYYKEIRSLKEKVDGAAHTEEDITMESLLSELNVDMEISDLTLQLLSQDVDVNLTLDTFVNAAGV